MSRAPKRGAKVVFFFELAKLMPIYFQHFPHRAINGRTLGHRA